MKKGTIIFIGIVVLCIFLYYAFGVFSSSVGWYGYQKWKYRGGTTTIKEAKQRKVFVKELEYKIVDSANLNGFYFKAYIEKGFRYGYHSMEDTRIDNFSHYPYNLSYERNKNDSILLDIFSDDKKKLDSCDVVWGYLKQPYLQDTIRIKINGAGNQKGIIKIW
ncbi:hypothetical protein D1631_08440 [Chryseobacterium nematophagum]|uniref:Uncharacterized protein n=1 Tax=Chryseobacterium nematophagum TaxID=2305228 RepID=A0A3M7TIC7_9FLAO|nr:hypothetical protein [Chryseobacterium nematophagum]RNA61960.1 hypothetical protein D1631_08440 [Chryseobacterium nematophagum]